MLSSFETVLLPLLLRENLGDTQQINMPAALTSQLPDSADTSVRGEEDASRLSSQTKASLENESFVFSKGWWYAGAKMSTGPFPHLDLGSFGVQLRDEVNDNEMRRIIVRVVVPVVAKGVTYLEPHLARRRVDACATHVPIEHLHSYLYASYRRDRGRVRLPVTRSLPAVRIYP